MLPGRAVALAAAALTAGLVAAPAADANTYGVTHTGDSGTGSLRWGIEQANAHPGFDMVRISNPFFGGDTIRPLTPLPPLADDTYVWGFIGAFFPPNPAGARDVFLDGSLMAGGKVGFHVAGDRCQIIGFAIGNFSDGQGGGIGVLVEGDDSKIWLNFIGTDRAGTAARPNDTGIVVRGMGNEIGDPRGDPGWISLASGNGVGISFESPGAAGSVVRNMWVGLASTGAALPNSSHGVRIVDAVGTQLGTTKDPVNRIAFNGGAGIAVLGPLAAGNEIVNAVVFGNDGLPVDLEADGITANDPGDTDAGPHGLQNFPVFTSAAWVGNYAEIHGTLESAPLATYRLDFYAGPALEPSGHARGERAIGTLQVTTNAAGTAAFTFFASGVSAVNRFVGASATDSLGNMSEMSLGIEVLGAPPTTRIFVVNTADGVNDGACLPAHCSLVEAKDAANQAPNGAAPDRIHFAIPGPGPHAITGNFWFQDPVVIDGYTQPGASPNTIPFGAGGLDTVLKIEIVCPNIAANDGGIILPADSLVRGLAVRKCGGAQVSLQERSAVEGCFLGTDASATVVPPNNGVGVGAGDANRVGGTSPDQRNLISGGRHGITISGSGNAVEGNLIGTTRDGLGSISNFLSGVYIIAGFNTPTTGNVIGGSGAAGNVISGNSWTAAANTFGVHLSTTSANSPDVTGNVVRGNWIGLNARGDAALPNKTGIAVTGTHTLGNLIEGNVISGNFAPPSFGSGIYLFNGSRSTTVRGNWIGTGPSGQGVFANGDAGIGIFNDSHSNVIEANTIRGNLGPGVAVVGTSAGNVITRNAISINGELGIDLAGDGVTANDPGDTDTGPNQLQNFPTVLSAATDGATTVAFDGAPQTTVTVEFFASFAPDASGHGEGRRYLGSTTLTTDASGAASRTLTLAVAPQADEFVTATATASGNTSEFGPAAAVFAGAPVALVVDGGGNRVLEPGETVVVAPSWRNGGVVAVLDGTASNLTGPSGGVYVLADAAARYGTVPAGGIASCLDTGDCYAVSTSMPARPQAHVDANFHEDVTPGAAHTWTLHVGASYDDVPSSSPYYRFVETVLHKGVMGPCGAGTFCPGPPVLRAHMAPFVLIAKEPAFVPPPCTTGAEMFADVPASNPYCRWIEELVRRAVVSGCGGGNYCPDDGVSREQMAVYLLATKEGASYAPPPCGVPRFSDVPASSPFCRWVEELARRGITGGCGAGIYCPAVLIPREQMAVFLTVTFGVLLYGP